MSDKNVTKATGTISAILFACNLNAVRSAMAEAMVKATFPGKIFTDSCGVRPGAPDGFAMAVMQETRYTLFNVQKSKKNELNFSSILPRLGVSVPSTSKMWCIIFCYLSIHLSI